MTIKSNAASSGSHSAVDVHRDLNMAGEARAREPDDRAERPVRMRLATGTHARMCRVNCTAYLPTVLLNLPLNPVVVSTLPYQETPRRPSR